jgi:uncharacterized protein YlbG (UPF0298 family)
MNLNRVPLIVFYYDNKILNKLEELHLNVTYKSKKMNFAVFFVNRNEEHRVRNILQSTKGYRTILNSPIFDDDFNQLEDTFSEFKEEYQEEKE